MIVTIKYEYVKDDDSIGKIVDSVKIADSITKMSEIVEYIKNRYFGKLNVEFDILTIKSM